MLRVSLALALAAAAAGCAELPALAPGPLAQDGFEFAARVAVRYGNEAASGRVQWRHSLAGDELLITNPLGQGVARITRSGDQVQLETTGARTYSAPDAEALSEQVLGWRVPLAGLPQWVRGKAQPDRPVQMLRDREERLLELRQDDWRVEYEEYSGKRPSRLRLSRMDLEIRLVIDTWWEGPP